MNAKTKPLASSLGNLRSNFRSNLEWMDLHKDLVKELSDNGFIWDPSGLLCTIPPAAMISFWKNKKTRRRQFCSRGGVWHVSDTTTGLELGADREFAWRVLELSFSEVFLKTKGGIRWKEFVMDKYPDEEVETLDQAKRVSLMIWKHYEATGDPEYREMWLAVDEFICCATFKNTILKGYTFILFGLPNMFIQLQKINGGGRKRDLVSLEHAEDIVAMTLDLYLTPVLSEESWRDAGERFFWKHKTRIERCYGAFDFGSSIKTFIPGKSDKAINGTLDLIRQYFGNDIKPIPVGAVARELNRLHEMEGDEDSLDDMLVDLATANSHKPKSKFEEFLESNRERLCKEYAAGYASVFAHFPHLVYGSKPPKVWRSQRAAVERGIGSYVHYNSMQS